MAIYRAYDVILPGYHPDYDLSYNGTARIWSPGWVEHRRAPTNWNAHFVPPFLMYPDVASAVSMANYAWALAEEFHNANLVYGRMVRIALQRAGKGVRMSLLMHDYTGYPGPDVLRPPSWFVSTSLPYPLSATPFPRFDSDVDEDDDEEEIPPSSPTAPTAYDHMDEP